jgi:signal peptidase I
MTRATPRATAVVINTILAFSLVAIWVAFAPTRLGGKVTYVIVNGISMEPGYHLGDLTIMRKAATYQVGDVVTYRDAEMNAYVIHRIIKVDQDRYVLQGDNNSWIDAYHPTNQEIIGKLWIHIPKLGRMFKWLRSPLNMTLALTLLGGMLMASMMPKTSKRGRSNTKVMPTASAGTLEAATYLLGTLVLVFLGLSILAFLRPLTRAGENIQYQQESYFSYSATGAPLIYDTETVRSGEPVFPRLTCFLNIAFTYNVTGGQLQHVSGNYQLIARVMEEQSGWQRTIPMNEPTAFSGNSFSAGSNLDLCQIVSLVNTLKQETGLRASNFTLEVVPQVVMTANAMGNQITDSFEPKLVFRFDEVHFSLSTPKEQEDPLFASQQSSVENTNVESNTLSFLAWEAKVGTIRVISLLGLALSLGGLAVAALRIFGVAHQSQEALIRLKYGGLLVNVYERNLAPASMLVDVTNIDELAKLAERHNTVILHMALNFIHYYMVQCNGLTYRYVFSAGRKGVVEIEPPHQEVISYVDHETHMAGPELREEELFSYVINNNRTTKTEVTDTVILKKIRL